MSNRITCRQALSSGKVDHDLKTIRIRHPEWRFATLEIVFVTSAGIAGDGSDIAGSDDRLEAGYVAEADLRPHDPEFRTAFCKRGRAGPQFRDDLQGILVLADGCECH